jgi:hypothetical protein
MDSEKFNKNKIFWILFGCLILFAGVLCAKMVGFLVTTAATDQMFEQNIASMNAGQQEFEVEDDSQKIAQELIENNMFMPNEQRECPIKDINGVMGNEVSIQGQWYKVGDSVGDAIILDIGASYAKIRWHNTEKILELSNEVLVSLPRQQGIRSMPRVNQVVRIQVPAAATQTPAAQNQPDSLAWMGVQLSADQRQKVETLWSSMPEQIRSVMQQQWSNMPEAERTRSLQELDRISSAQLEQIINQRLGRLQ